MFTRKNSMFCASLVTAALLAIVAGNFDGLVNAQTTKATISGTVTDEKGAAVANAKIIAKNLDTNLSRETTSDGTGRYRIPELAAGQYEVTAEAHGFRPKIHRGIELTVGREVVVDLLLNVGNVQDKVVIQGDAALVETTTSAVKYLVNRRQVEELPLNGRDVLDNLQTQRPNLAPGRSFESDVTGDPNRYLDPTAFALQPAGFYGNLGRNTLKGPNLRTFDFSLLKKTRITERLNTEFRGEFFNIFNITNFSPPNAANRVVFNGVDSSGVGIVSSAFGQLTQTSVSSRQIQFGLKFLW